MDYPNRGENKLSKKECCLALDFDGVICESLLEAYLITWKISSEISPELVHQSVDNPEIKNIHHFRDQKTDHWNHFQSLVPFGNRSEDYLVIQQAVNDGLHFDSQEQFDFYKDERFPLNILEIFHHRFYEIRYAMMKDDWTGWLSLNEPYPGVIKALHKLSENYEMAVCTSKDGHTVEQLLDSYGILEKFRKPVYDKSQGASKRAHLTKLAEDTGLGICNIIFVDDKVTHLIDCVSLGARMVLSAWGYNSEKDHETAARHEFTVLELDKLAEI